MQATYTKLRDGSWGVKITGCRADGFTPHYAIPVEKRDGTKKDERIERLVWKGEGVVIYTIVQQQKRTSAYGGRGYGRRTGCRCGSIEDEPRDSDCRQCQHDNT